MMSFRNHLLFNNIFLRRLAPSDEERTNAHYFVHNSARSWYARADFSSPANLATTWVAELLNQQSLDLVQVTPDDKHAWLLVAPWDRSHPLYSVPIEKVSLSCETTVSA